MRASGGSATAKASFGNSCAFRIQSRSRRIEPSLPPPGTLGGLILILKVHLVVVTVAVHPVAYVLSWPTCIQHRLLPSWPPCIQHRLGNISNLCLCAKKRLPAS